jgi:hypothetical protein
MSEDFNLDQIMQESKERTTVAEDLATKDKLCQEDFSSDKELHDKGASILKDHNACACAVNADDSTKGRLKEAAHDYYLAKEALEQHQASLYLTIDFKAEGLTNETMRKAFITHESKKELEVYYEAKVAYDDLEREYELEVISLKKKEIFVL